MAISQTSLHRICPNYKLNKCVISAITENDQLPLQSEYVRVNDRLCNSNKMRQLQNINLKFSHFKADMIFYTLKSMVIFLEIKAKYCKHFPRSVGRSNRR